MTQTTITPERAPVECSEQALKRPRRHSTPRVGTITHAYKSGNSDALLQALKLKTMWLDSCWIWTGRLGSDGKPLLDLERRQVRAQRVLLTCVSEHICPSCEVRIKCGDRRCMNPEHLVLLCISRRA